MDEDSHLTAVEDRVRLAPAFLVTEVTPDDGNIEDTINAIRVQKTDLTGYIRQLATNIDSNTENPADQQDSKKISLLQAELAQKTAEIERLQQLLSGFDPQTTTIPKKSKAKAKQSRERDQAIEVLEHLLSPRANIRPSYSLLAAMRDFRNTVKTGKQALSFKPAARSFVDRLTLLDTATAVLFTKLKCAIAQIISGESEEATPSRLELLSIVFDTIFWLIDCAEEVVDHNLKLAKSYAAQDVSEVKKAGSRIQESIQLQICAFMETFYRSLHALSLTIHKERLAANLKISANTMAKLAKWDVRTDAVQLVQRLLRTAPRSKHRELLAYSVLSASTTILQLVCSTKPDNASEVVAASRKDAVYLFCPLTRAAMATVASAEDSWPISDLSGTLTKIWSTGLLSMAICDGQDALECAVQREMLATYEEILFSTDFQMLGEHAVDVMMSV